MCLTRSNWYQQGHHEVNLLRALEQSNTLQSSSLPRGSPINQGGLSGAHYKQTQTMPRTGFIEICFIKQQSKKDILVYA